MAVHTITHHYDSEVDINPIQAAIKHTSIPTAHNGPVRNLNDLPMVLTVEDLRSVLSISRNTAYQLVRCGQIRSVKVGSKGIRIPREAIVEFLSK
jgi:excisionase family DNA binding protein